jgi:hypothetical protein
MITEMPAAHDAMYWLVLGLKGLAAGGFMWGANLVILYAS